MFVVFLLFFPNVFNCLNEMSGDKPAVAAGHFRPLVCINTIDLMLVDSESIFGSRSHR